MLYICFDSSVMLHCARFSKKRFRVRMGGQMNCDKARGLWIRMLIAVFLLSIDSRSRPVFAAPSRAISLPDKRTLFTCHVDRLLTFRPDADVDGDQTFTVLSRQCVDEEVRLDINVRNRLLTLTIQVEGAPMRTHILHDVEQGSSGGSGAGGRADTTIRGKEGGNIFTLFAAYDNNGFDHDAALQIGGKRHLLLVCDSDGYTAPQASGLGRYGSTNIYALSADGLATKIENLPVEPDDQ